MRNVDYLLVGGGVSALRAAQQIRHADATGSILLVSDESEPPYDRPPLSKEYLVGQKSATDILLEKPETLSEQRIECMIGQSVTGISREAKLAELSDGLKVAFGKVLLATGGRPVRLDIPGSELAGVHYLRTKQDADAIARDATAGRRAVIVGGGFIGLELAATLRKRDVKVTLVEALPKIWARFGADKLSTFVADYCAARGVKFVTSAMAVEFLGQGRVNGVLVSTGDELPCDFVCVGIGIRPNVELAQAAGLEVEDGVIVDAQMRTSRPDFFAAGDVINYFDPLSNRRRRVEHWGHAEHSGQVAGRAMTGGPETYDLISYIWSDIFDLHLEFAGDEHGYDHLMQRGELSSSGFMFIYLKDGRVSAFLAVNSPAREYSVLRRLIQTRKSITGREQALTDVAVSLRTLLKEI